jgi:signal transduction histidine kinase
MLNSGPITRVCEPIPGKRSNIRLTFFFISTILWRKEDKMKKLFILLGLSVLFFAASSAGAGETDWKEKENRLHETSGKERVELLVELTEHFRELEPKKALAYGSEALELLREFPDPRRQVVLVNDLGHVHRKQGNLEEARGYLEQARELAQKIGDENGYAEALHNISLVYFDEGDYDRSIDNLSRALTVCERLGKREQIATLAQTMGGIYYKMGDHSRALEWYLKAAGIFEKLGNKKGIAHIFIGIGAVNEVRGNDENALTYYKKALEYHRKYKEFHDAIFNEENSNKIAELQTRYDSEKKDKEIQLLKKNEEIQRLKLERQKTFTNFLILIFLLVVMSGIMFYARYRLKTQANRALAKEIQEHKRTAGELKRSAKMETVGILASGIAHDFNNILGVIIGYLDIIKMKAQNDKYTLSMIEKIRASSDQAAGLAEKILTLSQTDWGTHQVFKLDHLLRSTAHRHPEIKPLLENLSIPPHIHAINGDERQLRELFFNLLKNADEATSEPKDIVINAENITLGTENDFSLDEGDYVKISITDNGTGIPPENLEKIFDPYFSTRDTPNRKGLGLGLAVCYAVVQKHKGYIEVKSDVGIGTTVDLYLPAVESSIERRGS